MLLCSLLISYECETMSTVLREENNTVVSENRIPGMTIWLFTLLLYCVTCDLSLTISVNALGSLHTKVWKENKLLNSLFREMFVFEEYHASKVWLLPVD
jgi:hypothetical protein